MNRERLERLLGEVKSGKASIASALKQLRSLPSKISVLLRWIIIVRSVRDFLK